MYRRDSLLALLRLGPPLLAILCAAAPGRAEGCRSLLAGFDCLAPPEELSAPGAAERGHRLPHAAARARPLSAAEQGGRPVRFSVEVQGATGLTAEGVGHEIARILSDPRGWQAEGRVRFVPVTPDRAQVRFVIASPSRVDQMCRPLRTLGYLSCRQGRYIVMNAARWQGAMPHWHAGLPEYRAYLVNHEMGHALGHGHAGCGGAGRLAPVMMQQTKSLRGCQGNGWPFPARRPALSGLAHLRLQ